MNPESLDQVHEAISLIEKAIEFLRCALYDEDIVNLNILEEGGSIIEDVSDSWFEVSDKIEEALEELGNALDLLVDL